MYSSAYIQFNSFQRRDDGVLLQDLPTIEAAVCADPTFETGVGSTCENKTIGADCWAYCLSGYSGHLVEPGGVRDGSEMG